MKKIIILLSIIMIIMVGNKENDKITIPDKAIRIRVIANSNSLEDQLLKLKVKEKVTNKLYENLKTTTTLNDARTNIKENLNNIDNIVKTTLNNNNYTINYGNNYFPKKELYGISYDEGNYESLVINIGESKGNNWWCVLFPPLCMIEGDYTARNNVEYKSKVLEILKRFK